MLNNANWAKSLYGFHRMIGNFLPVPTVEITPEGLRPKIEDGRMVMITEITMDEAQRLADAAYMVAVEYDLAKYLGGKTPALAALIITAGTVYVPKVMMMKMVIAAQKAQAPQPRSAADMVNPQPEAANTDKGPGAYKYA